MTNDSTPKSLEGLEAGDANADSAARGSQVPHTHTYVVSIDGQHFKVDTSTPTGEFLLSLVKKRSCAFDLIAEYSHHETQVVDHKAEVDLKAHGLKGFLTSAKAIVTIFIDNAPFTIEPGQRTVAEILAKVGKSPESYILMQEKDGALPPLPNDLPVQIAGCEVFFTQVQSGGSSHP